MATGNEILSYQGNAAMGLGADGGNGLSVYGDTDTKALNEAFQNMAFLNLQKNKAVYDRKLKDRDATLAAISDGALQLNDALPKDRKKLLGMVEEVKDYLLSNNGDVRSDPGKWFEFNEKLAKFKTGNTVAQSRLNTYKKGMAEAAQDTNPLTQKKAVDWYQQQADSDDLYKPMTPYQKRMDYDPAIAFPDLPLVTSSPSREGEYDVSDSKYDLQKGYTDYFTKYAFTDTKGTGLNVNEAYDNFFGKNGLRNPATVQRNLELVNKKLAGIAAAQGYDPADESSLPEYLRPIVAVPQADGTLDATDIKPLASYKINIALKYDPAKVGTHRTINPLYLKSEKNKADIEGIRARAAASRSTVDYNKARAKYWDNKADPAANETNIHNVFKDVISNARTMKLYTNGKADTAQVVLANDIPAGFTDVLQGVGSDGNPIPLEPEETKDGKKFYRIEKTPYYVLPGGQKLSEADVRKSYEKAVKLGAVKNYEDFLKIMADKGVLPETVLKGKDGHTASAASTIQALRLLSNKSVTGKGDEILYQPNDNEK